MLRTQPIRVPRRANSSLPVIRQLTGVGISVGQTQHHPGELADPAPPVEHDGKIQIYGTGKYFLEYDSWDAFLGGTPGQPQPINLYHPDGTLLEGHQAAWDLLLHRWQDDDETHPILYAGVMTPTGDRRQARWPEDNWNRRVYAFRKHASGGWIREENPVFGERLDGEPTWINHCYGHHFGCDDKKQTWIFYEKVTEEKKVGEGFSPFRTEIFARRMVTPFQANDEEVSLLDVGAPAFPSTVRKHPCGAHAGYLVEGPRPTCVTIEGEKFYLLGFSSGDFPTDRYTFNVAWSRSLCGPYLPFVSELPEGPDLYDFGSDIREQHRLSWGPARPAFFTDPNGRVWVLFHAVNKDVLPDRDYSAWPSEPLHNFHRNLYLAPVSLGLDEHGNPILSIGD